MFPAQSPPTLDSPEELRRTTVSIFPAADILHDRHLFLRDSKQKLDDCSPTFDDFNDDFDNYDDDDDFDDDDDDDGGSSWVSSVRTTNFQREGFGTRLDRMLSDTRLTTLACSRRTECTDSSSPLQFFVRMMSESRTMVFQARTVDTVKWLHLRIETITKIPVCEQRLIYKGKQLQLERSLGECEIQNDVVLQLVGRMRSTNHPLAWQLIERMVFMVFRRCRGESISFSSDVMKGQMADFLRFEGKGEVKSSPEPLHIFLFLSAPEALVMLYLSPISENKKCAADLIKHFFSLLRYRVPKSLVNHCASVVIKFCELLRRVSCDDPLYISCRCYLGSLLEKLDVRNASNDSNMKLSEITRAYVLIEEILPFIVDLTDKLSGGLESTLQSPVSAGILLPVVCDFSAFLLCLRSMVIVRFDTDDHISLSLLDSCRRPPFRGKEIEVLYNIYDNLLKKMVECLLKMEGYLNDKGKVISGICCGGWSQYLPILRELHSTSELYEGAEERFWTLMRLRGPQLSVLIIQFATQADDYEWILKHKDVIDFEARRHLAMMIFPEVEEEMDDLQEMLIDRSQLLAESFEYISHADPTTLQYGLFMEFKYEEATGPGVLREWFFLVCQAIFNPQNALFSACPNDPRRFFPNPASKVDPLHLKYFRFSGRVIALALMNKVQVGVVFDSVFFLQLAGTNISLEDIKDADPCLYSSCKQILEMDSDFIDSDALGLTFVREIEELGLRKVVELCQGGKDIAVNSNNRDEYVKCLIEHCFVTSISEQVSHFAKGFTDILGTSRWHDAFFQCLEPEDLEQMLYGGEAAICVEDWKAHTKYNGYKETDPQILWFWKILEVMPAERRKALLFFWTSVKCLPVEGFGGLSSPLYIFKTSEPDSRLPTSHTCFNQLYFPAYPSMAVLKDRLGVITQEHVAYSFGNW